MANTEESTGRLTRVKRVPMDKYDRPRGWFQIGWSEEFAVGAVRPMRYFGRELVVFRTASGVLRVLDAYCPHLGAHLGYGGKVVDECIECPFHGWRWAGDDGRNTAIPYSRRQSRDVRIFSWPTSEANGLVYLWHDADGCEPSFPPPIVAEVADDENWFPFWPEGTGIIEGAKVVPQMIIENTVDLAHLKYVHGWDDVPIEEEVAEGDSWFRSSFSGHLATAKGTVAIRNSSEVCGVGVIVSRLEGLRDTIQIMATTPIGDGRSDVRFTVVAARSPDDPPSGLPPLVRGIVRAQTTTEWIKDAPIWENMAYIEHPSFAPEEAKGYAALRRWSARFYQSSSLDPN